MEPRPQISAIRTMLDELKGTLENAGQTQRKMLEVTGTAWSDDRLIRAVVGPRGQLIDLDIDARVYRNPNSKALAASIIETVRAAVEDANDKIKKIVDAAMPSREGILAPGGLDLTEVMRSHDGDLRQVLEEDGNGRVR